MSRVDAVEWESLGLQVLIIRYPDIPFPLAPPIS